MDYKKANKAGKLLVRACVILGGMCLAIALAMIWEII